MAHHSTGYRAGHSSRPSHTVSGHSAGGHQSSGGGTHSSSPSHSSLGGGGGGHSSGGRGHSSGAAKAPTVPTKKVKVPKTKGEIARANIRRALSKTFRGAVGTAMRTAGGAVVYGGTLGAQFGGSISSGKGARRVQVYREGQKISDTDRVKLVIGGKERWVVPEKAAKITRPGTAKHEEALTKATAYKTRALTPFQAKKIVEVKRKEVAVRERKPYKPFVPLKSKVEVRRKETFVRALAPRIAREEEPLKPTKEPTPVPGVIRVPLEDIKVEESKYLKFGEKAIPGIGETAVGLVDRRTKEIFEKEGVSVADSRVAEWLYRLRAKVTGTDVPLGMYLKKKLIFPDRVFLMPGVIKKYQLPYERPIREGILVHEAAHLLDVGRGKFSDMEKKRIVEEYSKYPSLRSMEDLKRDYKPEKIPGEILAYTVQQFRSKPKKFIRERPETAGIIMKAYGIRKEDIVSRPEVVDVKPARLGRVSVVGFKEKQLEEERQLREESKVTNLSRRIAEYNAQAKFVNTMYTFQRDEKTVKALKENRKTLETVMAKDLPGVDSSTILTPVSDKRMFFTPGQTDYKRVEKDIGMAKVDITRTKDYERMLKADIPAEKKKGAAYQTYVLGLLSTYEKRQKEGKVTPDETARVLAKLPPTVEGKVRIEMGEGIKQRVFLKGEPVAEKAFRVEREVGDVKVQLVSPQRVEDIGEGIKIDKGKLFPAFGRLKEEKQKVVGRTEELVDIEKGKITRLDKMMAPVGSTLQAHAEKGEKVQDELKQIQIERYGTKGRIELLRGSIEKRQKEFGQTKDSRVQLEIQSLGEQLKEAIEDDKVSSTGFGSYYVLQNRADIFESKLAEYQRNPTDEDYNELFGLKKEFDILSGQDSTLQLKEEAKLKDIEAVNKEITLDYGTYKKYSDERKKSVDKIQRAIGTYSEVGEMVKAGKMQNLLEDLKAKDIVALHDEEMKKKVEESGTFLEAAGYQARRGIGIPMRMMQTTKEFLGVAGERVLKGIRERDVKDVLLAPSLYKYEPSPYKPEGFWKNINWKAAEGALNITFVGGAFVKGLMTKHLAGQLTKKQAIKLASEQAYKKAVAQGLKKRAAQQVARKAAKQATKAFSKQTKRKIIKRAVISTALTGAIVVPETVQVIKGEETLKGAASDIFHNTARIAFLGAATKAAGQTGVGISKYGVARQFNRELTQRLQDQTLINRLVGKTVSKKGDVFVGNVKSRTVFKKPLEVDTSIGKVKIELATKHPDITQNIAGQATPLGAGRIKGFAMHSTYYGYPRVKITLPNGQVIYKSLGSIDKSLATVGNFATPEEIHFIQGGRTVRKIGNKYEIYKDIGAGRLHERASITDLSGTKAKTKDIIDIYRRSETSKGIRINANQYKTMIKDIYKPIPVENHPSIILSRESSLMLQAQTGVGKGGVAVREHYRIVSTQPRAVQEPKVIIKGTKSFLRVAPGDYIKLTGQEGEQLSSFIGRGVTAKTVPITADARLGYTGDAFVVKPKTKWVFEFVAPKLGRRAQIALNPGAPISIHRIAEIPREVPSLAPQAERIFRETVRPVVTPVSQQEAMRAISGMVGITPGTVGATYKQILLGRTGVLGRAVAGQLGVAGPPAFSYIAPTLVQPEARLELPTYGVAQAEEKIAMMLAAPKTKGMARTVTLPVKEAVTLVPPAVVTSDIGEGLGVFPAIEPPGTLSVPKYVPPYPTPLPPGYGPVPTPFGGVGRGWPFLWGLGVPPLAARGDRGYLPVREWTVANPLRNLFAEWAKTPKGTYEPITGRVAAQGAVDRMFGKIQPLNGQRAQMVTGGGVRQPVFGVTTKAEGERKIRAMLGR